MFMNECGISFGVSNVVESFVAMDFVSFKMFVLFDKLCVVSSFFRM